MAQVLISTAGSSEGEIESSEKLLNRSLLYNSESETLKIKWGDELIPIAGAAKQDKLIAGDNIEINEDTDEIRLADDIVIETMTLSPANTDIPNWKGTIRIGELTYGNCILLVVKESAGAQAENGIVGGEILIKSVEGDLVNYSQYALTITSTGSWTLKGGSNSSAGARVCKCLYNGEYYYGLRMPFLKKVTEKTVQVEVVKQRETQRLGSVLLTRTSVYSGYFRLLSEADQNSYVSLTNTYMYSGYNSWYYCSLDSIRDMFGWTDSNKEWYGKGYYVYFYIYARRGNTTNYNVRITQIALTSKVMSTAPSAGTAGVIFNSGVNESELFTNLNSDLVTNTSNSYYELSSGNVRLGSVIDTFIETYTEMEDKIIETEQNLPPETSEVWFNGWKDIPENLDPPSNYNDSQISYEVLSSQSHSEDHFIDIIDVPVDSNSSELEQILKGLGNTGEDGSPYRLNVSGTLTLANLEAIAALCRDPEKQIYLDLSGAVVASDAEVWDTDLFRNCVSLRGFKVPQGLKQIVGTVFLWCTYLRELDLSASKGTLNMIGGAVEGTWGASVSLLTSTRVRSLIIPNSVTFLSSYFVGASNIKDLILTHQKSEVIDCGLRTFAISSGDDVCDLPANFHMFVSKTYATSGGYLYDHFIGPNYWSWGQNDVTNWAKPVVESMVLYDPDWSQSEWQTFATTYDWDEELVNKVRSEFGKTDNIEILSNK